MNATVQDSLAPVGLTQGRAEATLAGETLANRYDVLELLGIGGMGAVYRARDRELDELVALKVMRRELADVPSMIDRFRHEVKLARRVTHGNVARTFEIGTADGVTFCTMELVEGESLAHRIKRGPLPVGDAVAIASAVCDGLAAAHAAGVIHRDIKPDNILLGHDGRVVIADFGVAAAAVATTGELSGTLAYMAPEQSRGEPATPASDVYSLALVLRELVGGALPAELASVVTHATHADAAHRIPSAAALRAALAPWTTPGRPTIAPARIVQRGEDLATIVVIAPYRRGEEDRQYLATAVHEAVLARLTKTPRLRVLPREGASTGAPTLRLELELQQQLEVRLTLETGAVITERFPSAVEHVRATADAVVATVEAELARVQQRDERTREALDLFLQARHIVYRDVTRMPEAIARLERARELDPHDPRIAATLAVCYIRYAFFRPQAMADALPQARLLATAAVTSAPDLADGHMALGHLELCAGAPVRAAMHFRMAIARAPQLAEAHEQLGRLLLEAGYIDLALARLDEAVAIAPDLRSAQWEISRSLALDGRWEECDRLVASLLALGLDRPLSRARYAWWRGDRDSVRALRAEIAMGDRVLWPGVVDALFAVFLGEQPWQAHGQELLDVLDIATPNLRRRTYVAQLACEAAAFAGEPGVLLAVLDIAIDNGLFDLHWLDRCPLFDRYRSLPAFIAARDRIAERAHAILDALYGDNVSGASATVVAMSATVAVSSR